MSMFFKRLPKDLEYNITTEEFDPETGDDKDEPDEINEKLFVGDNDSVDYVKSVYKNAKYIRFRSYSATVGICVALTVPAVIVMIVVFGLIIWLIPQQSLWFEYFGLSIGIFFLICFIFGVWFNLYLGGTYEGYFFKTGAKSATFYFPKRGRDKNLVVSFNKKSAFQYNPTLNEFVDVTKSKQNEEISNKLLFSYMYGSVESKKFRKQTNYYSRTNLYMCTMQMREGKLKKMEYMPFMNRANISETLNVYNYNDGDHVLDVPKAFLTLCEEKGIKAPESEHIRYI